MSPTFSILSRESIEHPHALFAEMRRTAPVCQVENGWWALSRYQDVVFALKTPEIFSSRETRSTRFAMLDERLRDPIVPDHASIISNDPPVHTRLRKLITGAFTPRAMARLEQRIRAIVVSCVDSMIDKDRRSNERSPIDLITDLASPLPVVVIAELLGVDPARRADFQRWSDDLVNVPITVKHGEAEVQRILRSRREFREYFDGLLAERRQRPTDDLIGDLCRAEAEDEALTTDQILSLAITLLVAGNITTTNLIGNGTLALLEHPNVLARVRARPELVPCFIEEVLRYDGPALMVTRQTTREVTLSGVTIPEGALVLPLLAAANRDPEMFPNPDRFDIDRETRGHVAFGFGIHFCVGAPLSRLEGRIAFDELLRRLPAFSRGSSRSDWMDTFGLRGLRSLPLTLARPASVA
jgi:cytochrome P450